jgi:hypothetical protein
MHYLFFFVFSLVAAMLFNWFSPIVSGLSFLQPASGASTTSIFIWKTLATAVAIFGVLIVAGLLMDVVVGSSRTPVKV